MPAQKKRKLKKPKSAKSVIFTWTPKRKLAAKLLSESTDTYEEIAKRAGINRDTLLGWRKEPIFVEEVKRLTLQHEAFSLAGLLKGCLKGLNIKENYINEDKNTYLDYIKEIADLQGYTKQKVELDANLKHSTEPSPDEMTDEELRQSIKDDIQKLITAGYVQTGTNGDIPASPDN